MGKKSGLLLDISHMVSYYGYLVAYIIVSENGLATFVKNNFDFVLNTYATKALITFVLIFPLCLLKSLHFLLKISTYAGVIIFIFVITIVVYFFMHVGDKTLCSYDGHDIKYSLPSFPRVGMFESIMFFFMYIPSMICNFSAHPVVPMFL